ncbi:MAG: hypothetical protein ACFFB3_15110 [Candidatus Hodarchaeota archaeon]
MPERDDILFRRKKKTKEKSQKPPLAEGEHADLQEMCELIQEFGKVAQRMSIAGETFAKASIRLQMGLNKMKEASERLKHLQTPKN